MVEPAREGHACLMAAALDFQLPGEAFGTYLSPIPELRHRMQGPDTGGTGPLTNLTGKLSSSNFALCVQDRMPPEELQERLWDHFFADPTQWWSKPTPQHPDFRHKESETALWLDNRLKPAWVDWQLARWDAGGQENPESAPTAGQWQGGFAADEGHLEVKKLCEDGRISDAVEALNLLVQRGRPVESNLYYRVLRCCISHKDLALGRRIHALTVKSGYEGDAFLATHLIGLYASHRRLEEAMRVFNKVSTPSSYNWATIIFAYARHGEPAEAIRLYQRMRKSTTVEPDNRIYVAVLKACAAAEDLVAGKEVHAHVLASPRKPDIFVQNGLVDMYAKCRSLEHARRVFDRLPDRNVVIWTAMIAGYAKQGMGKEALRLYRSMQQEGLSAPDSVTYVCLLQACASVGVEALHEGKQLHSQIKERGLQEGAVLGSLVNMYAKCGSLEDARGVFDILPGKHLVTWTAMIAGYAQQGMGQEAISLYRRMQQEGLSRPDAVTYVCLLQACASVGVGALLQGRQLHAEIEENGLQDDLALACSLVNMYAKCGSLDDARRVFDGLPARNIVTWTAMIAGYAQQGMGEKALSLYRRMHEEGLSPPDSVTYLCLLQACASVGVRALYDGKRLHAQIKERGLQEDAVIGGSLVDMYVKCGSLEGASRVFDILPTRNVVTWTAMIAGYAQQGMGQEALSLYSRMQLEGLTPPSSVTYVCLLQACAFVAALPLGKQLHAQIEERGLQGDLDVGAAVVNMYAKCGSMFDSQQVFDSLPERTVDSWNALIGGYSRQGDSPVVFDLLDRMRLEGIHPDEVTFLSVLTVCSHVGLVDKGRHYYHAMTTDYGISVTLDHFTCMIDLLGRAGHLEDALQMAKTMPFQPNSSVWHTLLAACWKWKNVEIGQQAFEGAVKVEEKDGASYVLMSNIYASALMWDAAKDMQTRRKKLGAWKKPGQSWWTDLGGVVHTFAAGDKKHPESAGIYARLERLVPRMKKVGYEPHLHSLLRKVSDDEKEAELCGHSEKLAVAYALNKTPEGTTIRIVKNLRVCADCHTATACISKVEKRTIICRDSSRFHVFKEGKCSCGDYW